MLRQYDSFYKCRCLKISDESKLDKDDGEGFGKLDAEIKEEASKKDEKKEDSPTEEDKKLLDGEYIYGFIY